MSVDRVRRSRLTPLLALVPVITDQFLLLRVHGNNGVARPQSVFDGAVDMPELRVSIGMIVALLGLAVASKAVATFTQELSDFGVTDRMASDCQFRRQRTGALAGPAQGRLRIAARRGFDHTIQSGRHARIVERQRMPFATLMPNPARSQRRCLQFLNALAQRDMRDAAITQFHRFAGGHQAAGVVIQMRPHARKQLG